NMRFKTIPAADWTRYFQIVHEIHIGQNKPESLAVFTPSAQCVERKVFWLEVTFLCFRQSGKQIAYERKYFGIVCNIGTLHPVKWRLVDGNDFTDLFKIGKFPAAIWCIIYSFSKQIKNER